MLLMTSPYRLTIVSLYRHFYTKCIQITYKGSLYFGISGVPVLDHSRLITPSAYRNFIVYNDSLYFAIPGVSWTLSQEEISA
jgi:hypothetical protein